MNWFTAYHKPTPYGMINMATSTPAPAPVTLPFGRFELAGHMDDILVLYERLERAPADHNSNTRRAVIVRNDGWHFAGDSGIAQPVGIARIVEHYGSDITKEQLQGTQEEAKKIFEAVEMAATGKVRLPRILWDANDTNVPAWAEEMFCTLNALGVQNIAVLPPGIRAQLGQVGIRQRGDGKAYVVINTKDGPATFGLDSTAPPFEITKRVQSYLIINHNISGSVSSPTTESAPMTDTPRPSDSPTPFADIGKILGDAAVNGLARSSVEVIGDRMLEFVRDASEHHAFVEMVLSTERGREFTKGFVAAGLVILPVFFPQVAKRIPKPHLIQRIAAIQFDSSVGRVGKPLIAKGMKFLEALVKIGEEFPELEETAATGGAITDGRSGGEVVDFSKAQETAKAATPR